MAERSMKGEGELRNGERAVSGDLVFWSDLLFRNASHLSYFDKALKKSSCFLDI